MVGAEKTRNFPYEENTKYSEVGLQLLNMVQISWDDVEQNNLFKVT
jgi:hypothetical protein